MPSLTLRLPLHVTARRRADGTYRVLFEVRRNRPPDWPSTIPLPLNRPRTGNLGDAAEVARIFADVEGTRERDHQDGLLAKLEAARNPSDAPPRGSLPEIAARWKASAWWAELRPRTQNFYTKSLWPLEAWSLAEHHPQLRTLSLSRILKFLSRYADRPAQQSNLKRTLGALFSFAREIDEVPIHPFGTPARLRKRRRGSKRDVDLWTAADVEVYRKAASDLGWPGGALLIWAMWETSADASDVVTWRKGAGGHFRDTAQPAIMFTRGKTGEKGTIPISAALADAIRTNGALYVVTDPDGAPYAADSVRDDNRRGNHFRDVRAIVEKQGGRRLLADHLRHSAATDAIENGASLDATTSLTLHANESMLRDVYVQMTERQCAAVQRARGIIP